MTRNVTESEVMTLAEAARYLRVTKPALQKLVEEGNVPARKVGTEWRFFRGALQAWLTGKPNYRAALMEQIGAFEHDETLPELLASIYAARGRPETDTEK